MKVRLYGPVVGNGSFARVTRGTEAALRRLGMLVGLVPIDAYDEEEIYSGYDAEVGLFIGPPHQSVAMRQLGQHSQRLLMLAPNSSWLPQNIFSSKFEDVLTGFVSPSKWGADVIRAHTSLPVEVLRHGVSEAFHADPFLRGRALASYREGQFHVAHFASTTMQRKGTEQLLEAWATFLTAHPEVQATLTLVVDAPEGYYAGAIMRASAKAERLASTVSVFPRMDLDEQEQALFYSRFHAIVQPSRGEGFGLVPLEARACGVPVAITDCTGHSEHAHDLTPGARLLAPGVQIIATGAEDFIDDGPGAKAPTLSADMVARGLGSLYENWNWLNEEALACASETGTRWSWDHGIMQWLNDRRRNRK